MSLPAITKTIKKSVYLTEQFKQEAKAAGLRSKDTNEVADRVAQDCDEGEVCAQLQQNGVLTVRTLRWRDHYTVLYLSALDGRELYLLSLLEPKDPQPPTKKNGSKRVMALLEKIGVQLVIEAIKWFFRGIRDKDEVLDDTNLHRSDALNCQAVDVFSNKKAIELKKGLFVRRTQLIRRPDRSDIIFFSTRKQIASSDFCATNYSFLNKTSKSLMLDAASDSFSFHRAIPGARGVLLTERRLLTS